MPAVADDAHADRVAGASGDQDALAADWPPFAIRLRLRDLSLRPVREADLAPLLRLLPDDVEHDPSSELFVGLDLAANRRRLFLQACWRSTGSWSVVDWFLPFLVSHRGRPVGVQALEATQFPELRTVDSWSWLDRAERGKGIGVAMRAAVLALAFDHLGAERAVSSAREDNLPSLGVSRRLGYQDNGISRSRSPSGPCTLRHLILHRSGWTGSGRGRDVEVRGLERCGPWFGVDLLP